MKFNFIKNITALLIFIELFFSCFNMLYWDFFIAYRKYLIIFLVIINSLLVILNEKIVIRKNFLLFFFSILSILFYLLTNISQIFNSIENVGTYLLLINLFLTWISFRVIILSKKQINFFIVFLSIYGILFLFLNWNDTMYNPNTLATFSFPLLIFTCIFLKKYLRTFILYLIVFFVFFYFSYKNLCRSVLIGEIIFVVLCLTDFWLKPLFSRVLCWILCLGPTLLPIIWTKVWEAGIEFNLPFVNKSIYSGRERVWNAFLDSFYANPFLGIGQGSIPIPLMDYKEFTPHNFMFFILVVYGIVIYLFSVIIMNKILIEQSHYAVENNYAKIAFSGLLSILIVSFFEIIPILYIHVTIIWFLLIIVNSRKNL